MKMSTNFHKKEVMFVRPRIGSQSSWKKGYGLLIKMLFFYGINTSYSNTQETVWHKAILLLCPVCMHLTAVQVIWTGWRSYGRVDVKILFAVFLLSVTSLLLWYMIYFKKRSLKTCMERFHAITLQHKICLQNRGCTINVAMAVGLLIPEVCFVISALYMAGAPEAIKKTKNFFVEFEEGDYGLIAIRCIMAVLNATLRYTVPSLVAVVLCTLYYRFSDLVNNFNEKLSLVDVCEIKRDKFLSYMKTHQALCDMAHQLEQTLSTLSFFLISTQLLSMFITLASLVIVKTQNMFASLIWESVPSETVVPLTIVCTVYSASRIAKQHGKTLILLQAMHDKLSVKAENDWKFLGVVKRMKENSYPAMTAGGIVDLRPSLVLSAFGCLLTYGLLVLSVQG